MAKGAPAPDELAAIVAAIELAWPRPVVVVEEQDEAPNWRWSGRWWTGPVPLTRQRPWS
jgi:hypothetical protein